MYFDPTGNTHPIETSTDMKVVLSANGLGILFPGLAPSYTDGLNRRTDYQYDGLSQPTRRIDPQGNTLPMNTTKNAT